MSETGSLLGSCAWARVLERGFGCRLVGAAQQGCDRPAAWAVFKRFGVHAAYLNFPVGFDEPMHRDFAPLNESLQRLRDEGVDLARFSAPGSAETPWDGFRSAQLIETCVDRLDVWSPQALSSATRRKLARCRAGGLRVRDSVASDAQIISDLYGQTIHRNRGRTRYTRPYFDALCDLSLEDRRLSIGIVLDSEEKTCGFIAVAHGPVTSYYLHGGFSSAAGKLRPGYAAMEWAILRSRDFGSTRFNMLTSPRGQDSLVAYKESFGGRSYLRSHYDVPLSFTGNAVKLGLALADRKGRPGG